MSTAPSVRPLPRLTIRQQATQQEMNMALVRWADDLVHFLQTQALEQATAAGQSFYTTTNVTPARSLNATTATVGAVANVLGTLISDLKAKGSIA